MMLEVKHEQQENSIQREYKVKKSDLPVCCPPESVPLWNAHPRVYLPFGDQTHELCCPYCGAKFVLIDA